MTCSLVALILASPPNIIITQQLKFHHERGLVISTYIYTVLPVFLYTCALINFVHSLLSYIHEPCLLVDLAQSKEIGVLFIIRTLEYYTFIILYLVVMYLTVSDLVLHAPIRERERETGEMKVWPHLGNTRRPYETSQPE